MHIEIDIVYIVSCIKTFHVPEADFHVHDPDFHVPDPDFHVHRPIFHVPAVCHLAKPRTHLYPSYTLPRVRHIWTSFSIIGPFYSVLLDLFIRYYRHVLYVPKIPKFGIIGPPIFDILDNLFSTY
jgi:hypothetical protein